VIELRPPMRVKQRQLWDAETRDEANVTRTTSTG
jgi:hypothetical protein